MKVKFPRFYDVRLRVLKPFFKHDDFTEKIIEHIQEKDKRILDIYCKTGTATIKIAKKRPYSHVIGMDQHQFIKFAKRKKRQNHVRNLDFMHLSNLELANMRFDVVTLIFVLNQLSTDLINQLLGKIKLILKDNKKLIIVDYTEGKDKVSKLLLNFYHFIFGHKNMNTFQETNICNLLEEQGFYQINKEEYNGYKMISSYKQAE